MMSDSWIYCNVACVREKKKAPLCVSTVILHGHALASGWVHAFVHGGLPKVFPGLKHLIIIESRVPGKWGCSCGVTGSLPPYLILCSVCCLVLDCRRVASTTRP